MADLSFAYANARVKAMKSKLFDRDRMRELMDVGTLPEFIELLEESPYKQFFVDASTRYRGLELVKRALDGNLAATLERLAAFLPASSLPVYSALVRQWEINNVKKILASKALGRPVGAQDLLPVAESTQLLEKLVQAPDLKHALEELRHSPYAPSLRQADAEYAKNGDFPVFLEALDKAYFSSLAQLLSLPPGDAFTRRFVRDKLDFANGLVILRMKRTGVSADRIRKHIVQVPGSGLADEMLAQADVAKALEVFARRKKISLPASAFEEVRKGGGRLSLVEVELERALLSKARRTLARSVLSLGVVVAFLHLKQEEVHSLRKIAYATQFDVKDELRARVLSAA